MNDPSTILRRNNGHRLSMASATRSSFRLDGAAANFASGAGVSVSAKRKSLLSTPASTTKRRQSSLLPGSTPSSSQRPVSGSPASTVDPRPLRDKNYISLIQSEVFEFLVSNKFEIESGGHPLTQRTLRQPTQRDFVVVFQFLYHRLDPNYRFTKTIDNEVFFLLRTLGYPYLDSINRTQIASVNSSNWPAILGMLYWLVKLNLSLTNVTGEISADLIDDPLDQIFIDYIRQSYKAFINNEDDYSEFLQQMHEKFEIMTKELNSEIDEIIENNRQLEKKLETLRKEVSVYDQAETKSKALESDFEKFKEYIDKMENRRDNWANTLDKIRAEVATCEEKLSEIESDKNSCEEELRRQGITPKEIDALYTERDKLTRQIDLGTSRLQELENIIQQKEYECSKTFESLDNFIKSYNAMIYRIGVASTTAASDQEDRTTPLAISSTFEISMIASIPTTKALSPNQIINKTLSNEKYQLLQLRSQINSAIHKHQDESIRVQEQLDLLQEEITEKRDHIEGLEAKLSASRTAYDEIYETMTNDTTTYSMQIEKLERELRLIKINTTQGLIEVENRKQEVEIEYEELRHSIQTERALLHDQVLKLIDFTIQFKINVQSKLEEIEDLVSQEQ